jgi:uncharacterized protein
MMHYLPLIPLGLLIGAFGTLIGAGGGFILAPVLLLLYPGESADTITSISLAVTFANALSGSVAYARMKRIDFRSGLLFSAAAIPGAILGALSTHYVPRRTFDLIFAVALIAASLALLVRPPVADGSGGTGQVPRTYSRGTGILISIVVGFVSSFLGIGGGIIHVPAMVAFLGFPVHAATATSHFILANVTFVGTAVHVVTGAFHRGVRRAIALGIGVLIGAQFGARLSKRVHGTWILRLLAVALMLVGVRLMLVAL